MVTLHEIIRREPLNLYDAFSPRDLLPEAANPPHYRRIFGNRNVGLPHLTNILSAGQVPRDETFAIGNWYARTNITSDAPAFKRAWDALTHVTICRLVVGCSPVRELPLFYLLANDPARPGNEGRARDLATLPHPGTEGAIGHRNDALAIRLYTAFWWPDKLEPDAEVLRKWDGAAEYSRDKWKRAAREAANAMRVALPVLVPERQIFSVTIHPEPRAVQALLEVMPTDIAPQALVWVHLEGVIRTGGGTYTKLVAADAIR